MNETREGRIRPAPPAPKRVGSLGLAVFGTMVVIAGPLVPTAAAQEAAEADSAKPEAPQHFRKTVFFNTPYLARAAEVALEKARQEEAEAASETQQVAEYARRYKTTPELAQKIVDVAQAEGIDPELGFRLIRVESVFNPRAVSPGGAMGLMQLMPSTARLLDRSMTTRQAILDPQKNLTVGFRYLRQMIERYDGNVRLGLLAYNRGEVAVDRALRRGNDPENGYSHKVLGTRGSNPYRGKGLLAKPEGSQSRTKAR